MTFKDNNVQGLLLHTFKNRHKEVDTLGYFSGMGTERHLERIVSFSDNASQTCIVLPVVKAIVVVASIFNTRNELHHSSHWDLESV